MKTIVDSLKVLGENTRMFESLRDNLFAPKGLKFNSQICTTREQSERLIALGLKKETADCYWFYCDIAKEWKCTILSSTQVFKDYPTTVIPAWSLNRLIEMYVERYISCSMNLKNLTYEWIINEIEIHIKEGDFNKEYLV